MDFNGTRPLLLLAAFGGGLVFGEACTSTKKNTNHCAFLEGDETCADRYPGEFEHCGGDCVDSENNDGCVATAPTALDCWYPCGGDQTAEDDMSCLGTTMTDTIATTMDSSDSDPSGDPTTADTSATTMGTMTQGSETDATDTTEGGGNCQTSADCMTEGFPVCLDNDCVPCTDAADGGLACTEKDETAPVCAASGECVQCEDGNAAACTGTTPVCDTSTSTCVGCTYHEQCSATACNMETGACFEDCIVDVEDGEIIGNLIEDDCVLIVHAGAYAESVQIGAGTTVALLAAEGDSPILGGVLGNGATSLEITGDAVVFVQGLLINGNDNGGVGVSVDTGTLYLDRTEVVANTGGGLVLTGSANLWTRNVLLGGDAASGLPALSIDSASATIVYTTAVGVGIGGQSITCADPGDVVIRNALLFTQDSTAPLGCAGATVSRTASDATIDGDDNVNVPGFTTAAFVNFGTANFLLATDAPEEILTAARWRTADPKAVPPRPANDPATDFDGTPRPSTDDAEDVAGADIP